MDNKNHAKNSGEEEVDEMLLPLTACVAESSLLDLARRYSDTYRNLAKSSTEHFLTTPVTALPSGKERGKFLAIDLGGSNLRVGFIDLLGEDENGDSVVPEDGQVSSIPKIQRSHDKSWPIGDHLKMDKAEDLFAWIGGCIAEVVTDAVDESSAAGSLETPIGDEVLLGITFSFPMMQTSMSEATLLPMGKGFGITTDLNLGQMLLAGYGGHLEERTANGERPNSTPSNKKRKLSRLPRIRLVAITNDTVATYTSLAYSVRSTANSRVAMGLIVGTGCNATVPMKFGWLHPSKVEALSKQGKSGLDNTVVINTEWTIRGTDAPLDALSVKTQWDMELDRNCSAPGFQPFEYMTAGRYLGELVRLVFVDLLSKDATSGDLPPALQEMNSVTTTYLATDVAVLDNEALAASLAQQFPATESGTFWSSKRANLMKDIALAVQQRSSALIAAASVGLLACVGDVELDTSGIPAGSNKEPSTATNGNDTEEIVIAYAGGLIAHYPGFLNSCQKWIDVLVRKGSKSNISKRVVLREALDGGVIGAAVLAGMEQGIA